MDSIAARRAAPAPRVPSGQVIDAETADPMQGETPLNQGTGEKGRTDPALSSHGRGEGVQIPSPRRDEVLSEGLLAESRTSRSVESSAWDDAHDVGGLALRALSGRKANGEDRSGGIGSVEPDTRPESFRRALADIKSHPDTADLPSGGLIDLVEAVEDPVSLVGIDPRSLGLALG